MRLGTEPESVDVAEDVVITGRHDELEIWRGGMSVEAFTKPFHSEEWIRKLVSVHLFVSWPDRSIMGRP